jgi:hypothetical protein
VGPWTGRKGRRRAADQNNQLFHCHLGEGRDKSFCLLLRIVTTNPLFFFRGGGENDEVTASTMFVATANENSRDLVYAQTWCSQESSP